MQSVDWSIMSGLQTRADDPINGVDVREQGSALRSVFLALVTLKLNGFFNVS